MLAADGAARLHSGEAPWASLEDRRRARSAATSPELHGEGSTSGDGRQGSKGPGPPRPMGRWYLTWPDCLGQGRHPPQGPGTQRRVW